MRLFWATIFPVLVSGLSAVQQPLTAQDSQSQSPFDDAFNKKVNWVLEHFDIPGVSVAVVRDEVFFKGYGLADIENSQPVTEDTLFFTGSTSKAFTAAAVSLLVDDNENYPAIQWTTPVNTLLPGDFVLNEPWSTAHITVADMLSHRTGLPRHDMVWLASITVREAVQSMRHLPFTAAPRTEWQYSNLMYCAAGHLIETVTNKSLHRFMTENIWQPLNMSETYLSFSEAQDAQRNISQGYYVNFEGDLASTEQVYTEAIRGAGNILSSAADYGKWISAFLDRRPPISEAGYAALLGAHSIMTPSPTAPFQSPMLYGFGWASQTYGGEALIEHDGAQFGYGANVVLLPQRKFGLAILGNNMMGVTAASNILAYHLIDEELGVPADERFDWITRGDQIINSTHLPDDIVSLLYPNLPSPPLPNPLKLSVYEGTYTHPAYPDFKISSNCPKERPIPASLKQADPDLCASFVNGNEYSQNLVFDLRHVSGTFWMQIGSLWEMPTVARVEFRIDAQGKVSWMGVEAEVLMAVRGEKIWWKHV